MFISRRQNLQFRLHKKVEWSCARHRHRKPRFPGLGEPNSSKSRQKWAPMHFFGNPISFSETESNKSLQVVIGFSPRGFPLRTQMRKDTFLILLCIFRKMNNRRCQ